ncbi:MAG: FHA domain-containing protein [Planctomycetota bacterium]|jgi:hypothetical protein
MPDPRPELIVVTGPRKGQRGVLMKDSAVLGRGTGCDVQVVEPSISRQHLKFALAPGGWVVENISANPIRINGKKYGTGRKAFVETGDVFRVGSVTDILYVSPDDDPDQALRFYYQDQGIAYEAPAAAPPAIVAPPASSEPSPPVAQAPPTPSPSPAAPPVKAAPPAPPAPAEAPTEPEVEPATDLTPSLPPQDQPEEAEAEAESLEGEQKLGTKKLILLIVAGAGMLIFLMLILLKPGGDSGEPVGPSLPRLTAKDVKDTLELELPQRKRNPVVAKKHLDKAQEYWRDRDARLGNLYLCIKHYKLFQAFSGGQSFEVRDERNYRAALELLDERILSTYRNAYGYSRSGNWRRAKEEFEKVHLLVPAKRDPEPEDANLIWDTVKKHLVHVAEEMEKDRR